MKETTVLAHPALKEMGETKRRTKKSPRPTSVNPRVEARAELGRKRMRLAANFSLGIAGVLTALSLHQLTLGIQTFTGEQLWLSAMLAVGIDLGVFAGKIAQLVSIGPNREKLIRLSNWIVYSALMVSAALNVYGAASHVVNDNTAWSWFSYGACFVLGSFIPGMTLGLLRIGAGLHLDCRPRIN